MQLRHILRLVPVRRTQNEHASYARRLVNIHVVENYMRRPRKHARRIFATARQRAAMSGRLRRRGLPRARCGRRLPVSPGRAPSAAGLHLAEGDVEERELQVRRQSDRFLRDILSFCRWLLKVDKEMSVDRMAKHGNASMGFPGAPAFPFVGVSSFDCVCVCVVGVVGWVGVGVGGGIRVLPSNGPQRFRKRSWLLATCVSSGSPMPWQT